MQVPTSTAPAPTAAQLAAQFISDYESAAAAAPTTPSTHDLQQQLMSMAVPLQLLLQHPPPQLPLNQVLQLSAPAGQQQLQQPGGIFSTAYHEQVHTVRVLKVVRDGYADFMVNKEQELEAVRTQVTSIETECATAKKTAENAWDEWAAAYENITPNSSSKDHKREATLKAHATSASAQLGRERQRATAARRWLIKKNKAFKFLQDNYLLIANAVNDALIQSARIAIQPHM